MAFWSDHFSPYAIIDKLNDDEQTLIEPNLIPKAVSGTPLTKMTAKGKTAMTIAWLKVEGAEGYDIFFATCNHSGKKTVKVTVK